MAAAAGNAILVEVVVNHGQAGDIGRTPGQAAHEKFLVIAGIVIFRIGISELAGQAIGQRVVAGDVVAEIKTGLGAAVGTAGDIGFAETGALRHLGGIVHRATGIRDAKGGGVAALQHFHTLIGIGFFAQRAKGAAERQAVAIGIGVEAANLEIVETIVGAIEIRGHAGGILQRLFHGLHTALLHFLGGDDGNRGGRIENIGRHLAAARGAGGDDGLLVIVAAVDGDPFQNRAAACIGSLLRQQGAGQGGDKRRAGKQGRIPVTTSRGFAVSAFDFDIHWCVPEVDVPIAASTAHSRSANNLRKFVRYCNFLRFCTKPRKFHRCSGGISSSGLTGTCEAESSSPLLNL
ncbi:hypothetical protein D3C80_570300 [compost metagenome]